MLFLYIILLKSSFILNKIITFILLTTLPLYHSTTLPLYHSTTLPLYHSTTLPLYHSTTLPLYHSTTLPLYPMNNFCDFEAAACSSLCDSDEQRDYCYLFRIEDFPIS